MNQEKQTPSAQKFRVAVSPLSWTNDVLEQLGDDTPLEQCLAEAAAAGYVGVELGRKFPREAEVLGWYNQQVLVPISARDGGAPEQLLQ